MSIQMAAILAEIGHYPYLFDLDRDGLGEKAAEASAAAIFEYMDVQIGPDNAPWIPLSERYAAWKQQHYPGLPMGELELIMKDPAQLKGELQISDRETVQTYGTDDTARDHAVWFQEGNSSKNQPPRPFYDFNDLVLVYLADLFDSVFATIR